MSQVAHLIAASRTPQTRVVGAVSAAHFVSHYYIILLAPLLPFVRADFGVSYTEIGIALSVFNIVTAALQTPAGFLIDRLGARVLLIAGLVLGAIAFIAVAFTHSFWVLVAMFGLAGVGNTVYHPADYTLLSRHVGSKRIGQAFSVHTFAGMLGSAVAPPSLLLMQSFWGWRGAFIGAGVLGLAVAALLAAMREEPAVEDAPAPSIPRAVTARWHVLLSLPILLNLLFFVLLAMISGGIYNYSVVALAALYGTPVTIANTALSVYLLLSAVGVLAGGLLVTRTDRHGAVASAGLILMALSALFVAQINFGTWLLIAVMGAGGFASGVIMPSRDMIVRAVTPPGSFGSVFGFVTSGFNIGGIIAPLVFGAIMDHGAPRWVFLGAAAFSLIAVITVATRPRRTVTSS
jgi:MFS family permease